MATDIGQLVDPSHCAVLTFETQRGIVGDLAQLPALAEAAQKTFPAVRTLLEAARAAGVPVVHCQVKPSLGKAVPPNYPLADTMAKMEGSAAPDPVAFDAVPDIGPMPDDYYETRDHGVTGFTGTSLNSTLSRLGVTTIIATGASLNLGIMGLAIEAVGNGFRVVVPTDCVAGVPQDYAESVIKYSLGLVARRCRSADLIDAWERAGCATADTA